jgi:hypothetical protein
MPLTFSSRLRSLSLRFWIIRSLLFSSYFMNSNSLILATSSKFYCFLWGPKMVSIVGVASTMTLLFNPSKCTWPLEWEVKFVVRFFELLFTIYKLCFLSWIDLFNLELSTDWTTTDLFNKESFYSSSTVLLYCYRLLCKIDILIDTGGPPYLPTVSSFGFLIFFLPTLSRSIKLLTNYYPVDGFSRYFLIELLRLLFTLVPGRLRPPLRVWGLFDGLISLEPICFWIVAPPLGANNIWSLVTYDFSIKFVLADRISSHAFICIVFRTWDDKSCIDAN